MKISAGCYHSVFASQEGMVYVCGRNNHGQLGTGDTNERHLPHAIDTFIGKRISMIAAGFYHTIILTGGSESDDPCRVILGKKRGVGGVSGVEEVIAGVEKVGLSSDISSTIKKNKSNNNNGSSLQQQLNGGGRKSDVAMSSCSPTSNNNNNNNHNQNNDCFSNSESILSLPYMSLSDEQQHPTPRSNHNNIEHSTTQQTLPSLPSSSQHTNSRNLENLSSKGAAANSNANMSDHHSAHTHHSQRVISFPEDGSYTESLDDVNSEVTLQSGNDLVSNPGTTTTNAFYPNSLNNHLHGNAVCEYDGTVRQDKGALFIMAHMERLCGPHIPLEEDYPTLGVLEGRHAVELSFNTIEEFDEVMVVGGVLVWWRSQGKWCTVR